MAALLKSVAKTTTVFLAVAQTLALSFQWAIKEIQIILRAKAGGARDLVLLNLIVLLWDLYVTRIRDFVI